MTTITKYEPQYKEGKPSGVKVNLSDGTWGYLVEKDSDKGLAQGDAVTYTAETPAGKQYKKLTIKKEGSVPSAPSSQTPITSSAPNAPKAGKELVLQAKVEASFKAMSFAIDAFIADKIGYEKVNDTFKELSQYLYDAIDEINK